MIVKTKTIEVYDIEFDEQSWIFYHEKEEESSEEYYIIKDLDGNEVVDDDLYDEIVEYFESDMGEFVDPFSFEEYNEDYD
tara:strand:+ start:2895 stop:3134 length:240 start_codon:yes stop_codon:yes gene_type:complete